MFLFKSLTSLPPSVPLESESVWNVQARVASTCGRQCEIVNIVQVFHVTVRDHIDESLSIHGIQSDEYVSHEMMSKRKCGIKSCGNCGACGCLLSLPFDNDPCHEMKLT